MQQGIESIKKNLEKNQDNKGLLNAQGRLRKNQERFSEKHDGAARKTTNTERQQRVERSEKPERMERPERPERVERVERTERPERPDRPDRGRGH